MPTVLRVDVQVFFTAMRGKSRPIFMCKSREICKVLAYAVCMADSIGFTSKKLQRIQGIMTEHLELFQEAWNEHFTQ